MFFVRKIVGLDKFDKDEEMVSMRKIWQASHSNLVQIFFFGHLNLGSRFYYVNMGLCQLSLADYIRGQKMKC
jgi:hypothetical protein